MGAKVKIEIQVKPNARKESIEQLESGAYKISVNASPRDGQANLAVVELLARHFKVPKSSITILRGHSGRKKLVEVLGK